MKRIILFLLFAVIGLAPQAAFAGPLDLGQLSEFVYKNVKKRGMVVSMFALGGQKAAGGALKFGVVHNRANTETYLAATVGVEAVVGEGPTRGRLHLGAPVNVADVMRRVSRWSWFQRYVEFIEIPADWELWAGPFVRAPVEKNEAWTWQSHVGGFVSVGKKFGS